MVSSFNEKPSSNEYYEDTSEYFNGDPCTGDCSGHEAGYEWAEEENIRDIDDCSGNSTSFNEGCESWVEEHTPDVQEFDDTGDRFGL
ncbi:MAG: hypothetical protein KBC62_03170 [Candidatus Pacebacteria bacterium]|nr:hypothetical protein [Candidatus Paceibacterota bacterium]MBP9842981.1 hypothetical protein [Candidatus Paceibacterota bacterium]